MTNEKPGERAGASGNPVISLNGVSHAYNGVSVLENVDLTIGEHELVCVVGPNGGGKTTLLKLILGLLNPTLGQVRVFGKNPAQARARIGYMPQHMHYDPQFPVSVMDIVLMGRLGHAMGGRYNRTDREAAVAALEELDILDFADHLFEELSGGQRQRVLIARALACDPLLLLLDEPTANVDLLVETKFYEYLRELNKRMTIMMVSHDLGFVSGIVQRVVCVNRRVVTHAAGDITGQSIEDIYGGHVHVVRHDKDIPMGGSASG